MPETSIIMFEEGFNRGIRCRFVSECVKVDSYVPTKEKLLSEIERNRPDVVFLDLDLYAKIDGIEISRKIRNQFDVPVMYV
jgi:DNA-binding response OmpR family regulator